MTYQLYYSEGSAAMGVRVLFEEMGVPYELLETSISMDIPRDPKVLELNPNGWIPVLKYEHGAIYECGAITAFLCDKHPEAQLAPGIHDPQRGYFLQWLFFFSSSLQNAYQMTYYPFRFADSQQCYKSVKSHSKERLLELWQVVEDALGSKQWMLGNRFSAVDIYIFMLTTWLSEKNQHPTVAQFPNIHRICLAMMERPSIQLVYESYIADKK